ncbi:MAG: oligopeptide/dipeptide ABC transporter ATP-binding protein [Christensenellales bacterium]|jgi:oligopeptide/dipeptide ABC transporter ATP-binding protein
MRTNENQTPVIELVDVDMTFTSSRGVFKKQTEIQALTKVNLSIMPGEVVALVGESGGGKTTVGNVISGILKPTGGKLYFDGVDVSQMNRKQFAEYRKQVQIVQQDAYAALNPAHTVLHALSAPLKQRGFARGHKQVMAMVREMLETVELRPIEQFINKYPHQLSGGQRQRILLARAISLKPKLIIADEPVSMIDVSLRVSALNLMSKLNRETGISFLYITHDLATARYIGRTGRIAIMYLGQIIEQGAATRVIATPMHPYLRTLISVVPVPDPWVARSRERIELKEVDVPTAANPPPGCRFHTRCPYAEEICRVEPPDLREYDGRYVACHLLECLPVWTLESSRSAQDG